MLLRRSVLDDRKRKVRAPGLKLSQWIYLSSHDRAKATIKESYFDNDTVVMLAAIALGLVAMAFSGGLSMVIVILAMAPLRGVVGTPSRQAASTLVMLGRCGSCGYQIDGLTPEADGVVVCPECGSAWHHTRLTQRNRDLWPPSYPLRGILDPSGPDDRGVLTLMHTQRTVATDSWIASKALDMASDLKWKQMLHIGLPIALVLLVSTFFGISAAGDVVVAIVTTMFMALALVPMLFLSPSVKFRREAFLGLGLCPCCLESLDRGLGQEDGCVVCACGSAWRAADITSPRVLCRHCSYDITGVPSGECPECGASKASRWQPLEVGHPYCARCGADMLGREKRTCEDCGAMYGLEYRDR